MKFQDAVLAEQWVMAKDMCPVAIFFSWQNSQFKKYQA